MSGTHVVVDLLQQLPDELRNGREGRYVRDFSCPTTMDIVQIVYRPAKDLGASPSGRGGAKWSSGSEHVR